MMEMNPLTSQKHYPLSDRQFDAWEKQNKSKSPSVDGSLVFVVQVPNEITLDKVRQVLSTVAERHSALRTIIADIDGQPRQLILPVPEFDFPKCQSATLKEFNEFRRVLKEVPFDLEREPAFRPVGLYKVDGRAFLLCVFHHMFTDGISHNILRHEILQLLNAYHENLPNPLPPNAIQYVDVLKRRNNLLASPAAEEAKSYWAEKLKGPRVKSNFPYDLALDKSTAIKFGEYPLAKSNFPYNIPIDGGAFFSGAQYRLTIPTGLVDRLNRLAAKYRTTLAAILRTTFAALWHSLNGQTDVIILTTVSGRCRPDERNVVGLLADSLLLRHRIDPEEAFSSLLERAHLDFFMGFQYQYYARNRVMNDIGMSAVELGMFAPVAMNHFTYRIKDPNDAGFLSGPVADFHRPSSGGLKLVANAYLNRLYILCEYATERFQLRDAELLMQKYHDFLSQICCSPEKPIGEMKLGFSASNDSGEPDARPG